MRQPSSHAVIGEAGPLDAPVIAALHADVLVGEPWRESDIAALLASGTGFALMAAGRAYGEVMPVGFAFGRILADEAELLALGVLPQATGQGLGQRLLHDAANLAHRRGARTIFLEVRADNAIAQRLYRRAGFVETGRRRDYYRNRDGSLCDAYMFSKAF